MQNLKQIVKEKLKAFGVHFVLSICILTLLYLFIFFVWYPEPLLQAVNGNKILLLIIIIDVIVGPLLTFVVYKKGKKTLKMDLMFIVLVQVCALMYGIYSLALAKPVWIVFNGNKFELIQKNEIVYSNEKIDSEYLTSNYFSRPKVVAVGLSDVPETRMQKMMEEVFSGVSLAQKPINYVNVSNLAPEILNKSLPLMHLSKFNNQAYVNIVLKKYPEASRYVPLKASFLDMTVLINKEGKVVKIVDLRPWK